MNFFNKCDNVLRTAVQNTLNYTNSVKNNNLGFNVFVIA